MQNNRLAIRQWTLYLIVLMLVGCKGDKGGYKDARDDYPQAESKETIPVVQIPARDVLFSNQEAPSGFGAYGYLIFTKRPSDDNFDRYIAVFNAFFRNLEPVSDYPSISWPSIMPTYWLAQSQGQIDKDYPDCQQWIEFYDYSRAKSIASATKVLSSEGPILVAWSQPFEKTRNNETALVLDLSDFSNDDLDRAFGIWMDRITRDPKVWNDGFNLVLAKESFRSFLEKYGDHIIRAVKSVKEIIS